MVLAPKRKRTPAPESDPARDWLTPYLEEPTPSAVHEILGTFVLREGGWRAFHAVFLGGATFVTALGALYLLFPESFRFDGFQVAKALVAASPFLVLSFWLRLRRRRLRRAREAYADAVADALTDIVARLDHTPAVDPRLRRDALWCARHYPRLKTVIEGIGKQFEPPLGWVLRKRGWFRRREDC